MDFKLVKKEMFRVVGIAQDITQNVYENMAIIPSMWGKACNDGTMDKLCAIMNSSQKGILGLCECGDRQWRYAIGVVSDDKIDDSLTELFVPEATWAVFCGQGTFQSIQKLMMQVHTEWLPTSGYDFGNAPEIEVYYNADPINSQYELWIPVVPKA